jgi:hypothetical protein
VLCPERAVERWNGGMVASCNNVNEIVSGFETTPLGSLSARTKKLLTKTMFYKEVEYH